MDKGDWIVVRPITEADAEGFRQAVGAVARERLYLRMSDIADAEGSLAFVRDNLAQGHPQWVAVSENRVVGWCDVVRSTIEAEHHIGSLGMGLIEGFREQGIGRRLIEATLAAADEAGMLRVELTVNAGNERAIGLYRSQGFVEEGRMRKARRIAGEYRDVLMMARLVGELAD